MQHVRSLLLLFTVLVLSSALPRHKWHWAIPNSDAAVEAQATCKQQQCWSAVGTWTLDGKTHRRSYHVCRQEGPGSFGGAATDVERDCFYTTAPCCSAVGLPHSEEKISTGQSDITVKFFSTDEGKNLCYRATGDIPSCDRNEACVASCVSPDPVCINNTNTESPDSCSDGVCTCKPEYQPPDCCKCKDGYIMIDGKCEKLCRESCERPDRVAGCLKCRRGYTPLPLCCDCTEFFFRGADETCVEPKCRENVESCEGDSCTCKAGYGPPPHCCYCIENIVPDSCNADGTECQCKPLFKGAGCCDKLELCEENCASFDATTGCAECKRGYIPLPFCCDCTEFFYKGADETCVEPECLKNVDSCEGDSCTCKAGYGPPPDCCYCQDNIVPGSCNAQGKECECKKGFQGDDCCTKTPQCTGVQDIFFLIDATNSNPLNTFCQQSFALELISAALNPKVGNDLSGTRIGTYLYPKNEHTAESKLTYFEIGAEDCTGTLTELHKLMRAFVVDEADFLSSERDLKKLKRERLRGSITLPTPSIELLTKIIKDEKVEHGADRKRVVVILTDGKPNPTDAVLAEQAITDLVREAGNSLTLIAAGVANKLTTEMEYNKFVSHVTMLANGKEANSYVTERNAQNPGIQLGKKLVSIMEANGAICEKQADEIRKLLSPNQLYYCDCNINVYFPGLGGFSDSECRSVCPARLYNRARSECEKPPLNACDTFIALEGPSAQEQDADKDLDALEKEIIAAVESVLENKGLITE